MGGIYNDDNNNDNNEDSPTAKLFSMLECSMINTGDNIPTIEKCQKLINDGANLNAINQFDSTPLLEALLRGNDDIGELLIKSGARYDFYEPDGNDSCISVAFSEGCIKTLMAISDIDINACDEKGNSLLSLSISKAKNDIAIALIKKGADVFKPYRNGMKITLQAIFEAARKPVIMFLLSKESPYSKNIIDINMILKNESNSLIDSYAKSFKNRVSEEKLQQYEYDKKEIIDFFINQS
jgi:ankyrin repeat protein